MRIYVPSTLPLLAELFDAQEKAVDRAFAATAELAAFVLRNDPEADEEEIAEAAQIDASYASLLLVSAGRAPSRRVVLAVDHPDSQIHRVESDELSEVRVDTPIRASEVVCAFVDEPAAAAVISKVLDGDDDAVEALADVHLLWYDAAELPHID